MGWGLRESGKAVTQIIAAERCRAAERSFSTAFRLFHACLEVHNYNLLVVADLEEVYSFGVYS